MEIIKNINNIRYGNLFDDSSFKRLNVDMTYMGKIYYKFIISLSVIHSQSFRNDVLDGLKFKGF